MTDYYNGQPLQPPPKPKLKSRVSILAAPYVLTPEARAETRERQNTARRRLDFNRRMNRLTALDRPCARRGCAHVVTGDRDAHRIYCSDPCARKAAAERYERKPIARTRCVHCLAPIEKPWSHRQRYCSDDCRAARRRARQRQAYRDSERETEAA